MRFVDGMSPRWREERVFKYLELRRATGTWDGSLECMSYYVDME